MTYIAVFIPVLARPHRVQPLVDSLRNSAGPGIRLHEMFLCSPSDDEEQRAVIAAASVPYEVEWEPGPGDYARKMNYAWRLMLESDAEWAFLAADDLLFRPGWVEAMLRVYDATGACVIGTNDLGNKTVMAGNHSTHTFVHRGYGECGTIDDPALLCHEGYGHQWVDTELIETAKHRETFAFAADSLVEHLHPFWGKGDDDATYRKGQASSAEDQALYQRRRRLWT